MVLPGNFWFSGGHAGQVSPFWFSPAMICFMPIKFDLRCDSVRGAGSANVPSREARSFEAAPNVLTFLCKHFLFCLISFIFPTKRSTFG